MRLAHWMERHAVTVGLAAALLGAGASPLLAASLKGSKASIILQSSIAEADGLTLVRNGSQLAQFVRTGLLVPLAGNGDYEIGPGVSYPYARPEVKLFVESFSRRYHAATGEKLVITSLTRPLSAQPRNASDYSVHPAGIAIDIRRSNLPKARAWIERELKVLEDTGVLDATRERHPPHYHVAVFPRSYREYADGRMPVNYAAGKAPTSGAMAVVSSRGTPAQSVKNAKSTAMVRHRVKQGESLWAIARRYGTSVERLRSVNGIGHRIYAGQVLMVPAAP